MPGQQRLRPLPRQPVGLDGDRSGQPVEQGQQHRRLVPGRLLRQVGTDRGDQVREEVLDVLPRAAGPVLAHALYRWEVAIRDTVLVGLLGAGGLGALLAAELATFDWAAVTTVLAAVVVLTWLVDLVSDRARAALR